MGNPPREIPSLDTLIDLKDEERIVIIICYGELDVRMHASKWFDVSDRSGVDRLAEALVTRLLLLFVACLAFLPRFLSQVQAAVRAVNVIHRYALAIIILAVPPPSDTGFNPKVCK